MRSGPARRSLAPMFRSAQGPESVFNLRKGGGGACGGVHRSRRKLEAWRAAARRVWVCWDALLASEPEARGRAFAEYTVALDAEAGAAEEMAAEVATRAGARG